MESLLSPPSSTLTIYAVVKTQSRFPKTKILWRSIQKRDQKVGILLRPVRVAIDINISYTLVVKNVLFFFGFIFVEITFQQIHVYFCGKFQTSLILLHFRFLPSLNKRKVVFPLVNRLSFSSCLIKKVFISDSNRIRTHNHLIRKRTLNSMVECSITN